MHLLALLTVMPVFSFPYDINIYLIVTYTSGMPLKNIMIKSRCSLNSNIILNEAESMI
jgi:hypothetical protein